MAAGGKFGARLLIEPEVGATLLEPIAKIEADLAARLLSPRETTVALMRNLVNDVGWRWPDRRIRAPSNGVLFVLVNDHGGHWLVTPIAPRSSAKIILLLVARRVPKHEKMHARRQHHGQATDQAGRPRPGARFTGFGARQG